MSGREDWLKSGEYLPPFMRDFHDQKDVFKAIDPAVGRAKTAYLDGVTWVGAQVYTVDFFLWFMARHGYTLQRSRKRVGFADMGEWLAAAKRERDAEMAAALGLRLVTPEATQ